MHADSKFLHTEGIFLRKTNLKTSNQIYYAKTNQNKTKQNFPRLSKTQEKPNSQPETKNKPKQTPTEQ
jgi:hypothetical protein